VHRHFRTTERFNHAAADFVPFCHVSAVAILLFVSGSMWIVVTDGYAARAAGWQPPSAGQACPIDVDAPGANRSAPRIAIDRLPGFNRKTLIAKALFGVFRSPFGDETIACGDETILPKSRRNPETVSAY